MTIIDRLEKWFGRFAIQGLIRYVVALSALVFILVTINPGYSAMLSLNRHAILQGEIWRLASWIFIPETTSFFWIIFYLGFTWWIGDMLEESWGTFRLNAYYFFGMILCIGSALIFGASGGNFFLNLSLFLAVATLAPNLEIYLFMILPVKMKWVAWFSLLGPVAYLIFGNLAMKMMVIMCLGNYLIFFAPAFLRQKAENRQTGQRRARFQKAALPDEEALHRCHVCAITEKSHPDVDFRVAGDGEEYCSDHLPKRTA